jgi:hypothetical protein
MPGIYDALSLKIVKRSGFERRFDLAAILLQPNQIFFGLLTQTDVTGACD